MGGRHSGVGVGADAEIWLVTSVCLYIRMSLVYERVLEKMFLGYWKVLKIFLNKRVGTLK